jgi:hypothetical protein
MTSWPCCSSKCCCTLKTLSFGLYSSNSSIKGTVAVLHHLLTHSSSKTIFLLSTQCLEGKFSSCLSHKQHDPLTWLTQTVVLYKAFRHQFLEMCNIHLPMAVNTYFSSLVHMKAPLEVNHFVNHCPVIDLFDSLPVITLFISFSFGQHFWEGELLLIQNLSKWNRCTSFPLTLRRFLFVRCFHAKQQCQPIYCTQVTNLAISSRKKPISLWVSLNIFNPICN